MCIRDSKPRSSLRRRRGRAVSRSRRGPDPEERRNDGAAQPTPLLALVAQPAPLLALAEGREEAAVAGAGGGATTWPPPTTTGCTDVKSGPRTRASASGNEASATRVAPGTAAATVRAASSRPAP